MTEPVTARRLVLDMRGALRRAHQSVIDAETLASRRAIVNSFRDRLRADPDTLTADDFLALADRTVLHVAIVATAKSHARADACDLQTYDPKSGILRLEQHVGFTPAFLAYFATVDADTPSACARALATGDPVLVDDVATSPIFAGHETREVMLAAGSRAVLTYPLLDEHGGILGVLSMHYRKTGPRNDQEPLVRAAAMAMARLDAATGPPDRA
ncbi:GAF domain-containing protein [Kutzneria sp. CA-103260]|uniref:GAF domain-containing protein n=1 Tax=Kutzneria sp. CA-103260 TaxID=2802641 RepID=UPI001BA4C8A9|nr:GAF domain-containing protein [Kutzneria sp. CA-103260]QUQ67183.1 GAF domain protein [Kutzneria sp. CA-103260]